MLPILRQRCASGDRSCQQWPTCVYGLHMRERNWASYIRPDQRPLHACQGGAVPPALPREISADADLGRAPAIIKQRERIKDNAQASANKAIKAIAPDLHVSRKVIRKAIRAPEGAFDYQRDAPRKSLPHLPNR